MIEIDIESEIKASFKKACDALNEKYIELKIVASEIIAYIEEKQTQLLEQIYKTEEVVNRQWQECILSNTGLDKFRLALSQWYRLRLREIDVFLER
jgi:hypothetical protein